MYAGNGRGGTRRAPLASSEDDPAAVGNSKKVDRDKAKNKAATKGAAAAKLFRPRELPQAGGTAAALPVPSIQIENGDDDQSTQPAARTSVFDRLYQSTSQPRKTRRPTVETIAATSNQLLANSNSNSKQKKNRPSVIDQASGQSPAGEIDFYRRPYADTANRTKA